MPVPQDELQAEQLRLAKAARASVPQRVDVPATVRNLPRLRTALQKLLAVLL